MVLINSETHQAMVTRQRIKTNAKRGGLLAGIGGLIVIGFPMLVSTGMNSPVGFQIKEGNVITSAWLDVPLPIYNAIYVWNIENPAEFRRGAKAKLREMGPYVYKQHRWKEVISWGRNQESVKFWALSSWEFNEERTVGTQKDKITMINLPVYAMAAVVRGLVEKLPLSFAIAPVAFGAVNVLFMTHGEGLLKEMTVADLVEGYPFRILDTIDVLTKPLTWFGIKLPDTGMPQNKFGLLHVKNFTKGGPYEVYTGQQGTKFLKFISYQDKRALDFYDDPKCNMYNGTDGTTMGSFLTKEDTLYVFNGDACRSLNAKYKELSNVKGIPAWRFILPASMFASPTKNPANKCFCQTPDDPDMCDGIFDLGPCQMGAPLAFSFPHFMHAGPKITANVEGMNPDVEKHESFFDVEPTIGAPMRAAGRLQVNVLMKPNRLLAGFGGVREAVVPFVWIEESAEVAGQFEWMLKGAIFPMLAIDYGSFFAMLGGMGLLGYTGVYAFNRRKILNPPKQEKPPVVTADPYQMDTQTKNMYPNPYTVSGRIVENGKGTGNESAWTGADPPVYSISQQQYNQSQNSGTQTSPINANTNPKLQRVTWSPPGSAEAYPME